MPVGADLSTANLASLSSHEAVGDAASLLVYLQSQYKITKTISFGCSYAGSLTTFARGTLPHLIHAAVASSAPVKAQAAHEGYNTVVGTSLGRTDTGGSPACLAAVRSAFSTLTATFTSGTSAAKGAMAAQLSSCDANTDSWSSLDVMWFATNAATILQEGVQYAGRNGSAYSISRMCRLMTSSPGDPLAGLAALMNDTLADESARKVVGGWIPISNKTGGGYCYNNSWSSWIAGLSNVTVDTVSPKSDRQWLFQCCTQFGFCSWGSCQNATTCPFSPLMNLEETGAFCGDAPSGAFSAATSRAAMASRFDWTNAELGGYAGPAAGRVMFVNGDVDPWSSISATHLNPAAEDGGVSYSPSNPESEQDLNPANPSIWVANGSHCSDYGSPNPATDSASLTAARAKIQAQVAEWLSDAYPQYGYPASCAAAGGGGDESSNHPVQRAVIVTAAIALCLGGGVAVLAAVRRRRGAEAARRAREGLFVEGHEGLDEPFVDNWQPAVQTH